MDIAAWLRGLGLEAYEATIRDSEIDAEVLPELTEAHLAALGLPLGPRLKLLKAITALREGALPPRPQEPGSEAPAAVSDASAPGDAERRQLTVMFCDLVGSTALAAQLDPEELREVIGAYHRCVTEAVRRFDGFVAKYMGDGVLIYFGYPRAHEDDAERAVRAGLAVVEAVRGVAAPDPLEVRVGIATGLVVVGDLVGDGRGAGAWGRRRDAEPGGAIAGLGRARLGGDRASHAPADRQSCSGCSHSDGARSRVSPSRSRLGRSRGQRQPRAASKRCATAG
jgi:hypothetical protein